MRNILFDHFRVFHGSNCPISSVGQSSCAICAETFAETRDTTGKRRCGHVCVEEAEHLRLVHVWTCTNDYRVDYS